MCKIEVTVEYQLNPHNMYLILINLADFTVYFNKSMTNAKLNYFI